MTLEIIANLERVFLRGGVVCISVYVVEFDVWDGDSYVRETFSCGCMSRSCPQVSCGLYLRTSSTPYSVIDRRRPQ